MSSDPRDRVLDYALGRVLREDEEVDRSAEILQAWSRGVPGSADLDELDLAAEEAALAPPRNGSARQAAPARRLRLLRPRVVMTMAAAAALLLLFLSVWKWSRPAGETPFAVASSGLEIRIGDTVRVESEPLDIRVANGAELFVEAGTVLVAAERSGSPAFGLERGSLELNTKDEPLWVTAELASVRALPGSRLTVSVDPRSFGKSLISLNVAVGAAELEHDGTLLTVVPPSDARTASGPVLLAEDDVERFDELFDLLCLVEGRLYEGKALPERLAEMEELSDVLAHSRPLWLRLAARVATLPGGFRGNAIDFLHVDPSEQALELARDLWLEMPEVFADVHMVAFAEREAFEFEREIEAQVEMYDPGLPLEKAPKLAAAYLAVRGDAAGRALLAQVHATELQVDWAPWSYLAAFALDRLGDEDVWEEVQLRVQDEVQKSLDESDIITASNTLLRYQYFHELRANPDVPKLGTFQADVFRWTDIGRDELQSEDEILRRMSRLFD